MKIACYTAMIGDYDNLIQHDYRAPGWDYFCFTNGDLNRLQPFGMWDVRLAYCLREGDTRHLSPGGLVPPVNQKTKPPRLWPASAGESTYKVAARSPSAPPAPLSPVKTARWHKIMAHKLLPNYDASIWVDANFNIRTPALEQRVKQMLADNVLMATNIHLKHQSTTERERTCQ